VCASWAVAGFQVRGSTVTGTVIDGGPNAMMADYAVARSALGDHGSATLVFNAHAGAATVTAHGCAALAMAGDPAGGGQGVSQHEQIILPYVITSSTLPVGTPVMVKVCVATSRNMGTTYTPPKSGPGFGDFADAGLNLNISLGGAVFQGTGYQLAVHGSPTTNDFTGFFVDASGAATMTIARQVGDGFGLNVTLAASGRAAGSVVGSYADGNSQASIVWGAAVIGADAQIRSVDDNSLFPDEAGCTAQAAVLLLPPPPPLGDCFNHTCPNNYYCFTPTGDCNATGTCQAKPGLCTPVYEPVCGCDGVSYWNACEAARAGVSVAHAGQCFVIDDCSKTGECPPGYYCQTPEGDCDGERTCVAYPVDCPELDDPVCGCDGENFANACEAALVGVSVAYRGPCSTTTPGDFNGDTIIDELDRAILCDALGSTSGRMGYVRAADLNQDNVIDHLDQAMFNILLPVCMGDIVSSATFMAPPDGRVDGADLAYLLGAWGNNPSCADIVDSATFLPPPDGKVDGADLAVLLGAWGRCK